MSKQKTTGAISSVWQLHLLCTAIVCSWLYLAERLNLPSLATIGVAGGVVLLCGAVVTIRVDKLQQVWRRENRRLKQRCASASRFTLQVVETLPALHVMFTILKRKHATGPMAMHSFAEWLAVSLNPKQSNLKSWIEVSSSTEAQKINLYGLVRHIRPDQQAIAHRHIHSYAQGILIESALRRSPADKSFTKPTEDTPSDKSTTLASVPT